MQIKMFKFNWIFILLQLNDTNKLYFTSLDVSIFCITGTTNAAVLPDPVLARTNISLPSKRRGIPRS